MYEGLGSYLLHEVFMADFTSIWPTLIKNPVASSCAQLHGSNLVLV
jgi:hypothetical protein